MQMSPKPVESTGAVTKLRANITPGTVVILLQGKYAGKRVVFIKQLPSGLMLVSGPRKLNGVPLKRVSQSYVISTSVKVDMSTVTLPTTLTEEALKKPTSKTSKKDATMFAEETAKTQPLTETRKALQTAVDAALLPAVEKIAHLRSYLKAPFALKKGQAPHTLKF
jgi:large subunit ribosomal protein L6e